MGSFNKLFCVNLFDTYILLISWFCCFFLFLNNAHIGKAFIPNFSFCLGRVLAPRPARCRRTTAPTLYLYFLLILNLTILIYLFCKNHLIVDDSFLIVYFTIIHWGWTIQMHLIYLYGSIILNQRLLINNMHEVTRIIMWWPSVLVFFLTLGLVCLLFVFKHCHCARVLKGHVRGRVEAHHLNIEIVLSQMPNSSWTRDFLQYKPARRPHRYQTEFILVIMEINTSIMF